jgi:lipopolysaccharide/colanic/teichoic acid biosynthesis glycosyltransferase
MHLKSLRILLVDLALVSAALVAALILRENLELSLDHLIALLPYWIITLVTAAAVLPSFGITRMAWRYSSMQAYLDIVAATVAIVAVALLLTFIANRLDGISRALPVLQTLLTVTLLVGARISSRLWHTRRSQRDWPDLIAPTAESVLLVGFSKLAELYIHCISGQTPQRVRIVGLLDQHAGLGLSLLSQRVLGTPEQVGDVLRTLEVHGILVTRIVLAVPLDELSIDARAALLAVEAAKSIPLEFLDQKIMVKRAAELTGTACDDAERGMQTYQFNATVGETLTSSSYPVVKRLIDIVLSSLLLIVATPVMALIAVVVAVDIGFPVLFWQERPGLGGRPFKVFKFRTMGAAHDSHGRRKLDSERVSAIGKFLRRTRFDELPQLFSILMGRMSFVGPRPLLPIDQPSTYSARLLVRPGLTGWAQIKGGRAISATDKAALDVWYVKHMSLLLDVKIVLGTVPMILFGERVENDAIVRAWREVDEWRFRSATVASSSSDSQASPAQ